MKKIIVFLMSCTFLSSGVMADYRQATEYVRVGNYPDAIEALQDTLDTDPKSQYLMGFMYYHGLGIEQSYNQAADYFERSMKAGNTDSITFLAYMYDEGKGFRQDKKKAFDLYQQASEAGDVTATMNLAVMYYRGKGIPQNYNKAFSLMQSIENARDPIVQFYLGNFYFYGFGVEANQKEAVIYYIRAAQLGSVEAHYMLGYIYQHGAGAAVDLKKALKYYEYAAYAKQPQAQFNLASMYASGTGGNIDLTRAYAWLSVAVDNDVESAKEALSKLSDSMSMAEISKAKQFLIGLNKQLVSNEMIESESAHENLGSRSLKSPTPHRTGSGMSANTAPVAAPVPVRNALTNRMSRAGTKPVVARKRNIRRR